MEANTSESLSFGELLRQFRTRKKLSQHTLAKQIGVSREALSFWERGAYKPETETMLYEIARVLALDEQERGHFFEAYTVSALRTSFHNPPFQRNPYFTGREGQLAELHTLLKKGEQVALTQAISGLGGIGKTQLALAYAYSHQKSYHDIFWALAESRESLTLSYVRFANLLHLPECNEPDHNKVLVAMQDWLRTHTGWLLILDNIEDLSLVSQCVPRERQLGAVLLTTRRQVTEPVAQALALDVLPENEAMLFLLKRTRVLTLSASLEDASAHQCTAARAIVQELGCFPLALDQAGAYILETACGLSRYLDVFQKRQGELLQRRIAPDIPTDHPESVMATFSLSFQQVWQRNELAGEVLRLCAFLAADGIAEEIFVQGADELGPILQSLGTDDSLLHQAIEALRTFSLIQREPEEKTLSVHRLVQAVLKHEMEEAERRRWAERVVLAVNRAFPTIDETHWLTIVPHCQRLLPQVFVCATHIQQECMQRTEAANLLYKAGHYLEICFRDREAEPLLRSSLMLREQVLGSKHSDVAHSLNVLAIICSRQSRRSEAEQLYRRALAIWEQTLGRKHPHVATCLNNIAGSCCSQGKYREAEKLCRRALSIRQSVLGAEHLAVASSLNTLGDIYKQQGTYTKAEPLYLQALSIQEHALESHHPNVTASLGNIAQVYFLQGKYQEAEAYYIRVQAIDEQLWGPEHPDVAYDCSHLGLLYHAQKDYGRAEAYYLQALSIVEKDSNAHQWHNYGVFLNNLAKLYHDQGKYQEAEPLYQKAVSMLEGPIGLGQPTVAQIVGNLAKLYHDQKRYNEAELLYRKVFASWKQHQLKDRTWATFLKNMADCYYEQGKYAEAKPLYQQVLRMFKTQLRAQHPEIVEVMQRCRALRKIRA